MKLLVLIGSLLVLLSLTPIFKKIHHPEIGNGISTSIPICGSSNNETIAPSEEGRYITALPGWGTHSYPVATESDSSQYFFNQGLNMYYGYHFREAVASFKESARFDPDNAMAYWGQALAMGPYYNAAHLYSKPEELKEILTKMNRKVLKSPGNEVLLVGAMNQRYSDDPDDKDRAQLNVAYAEALKALADKDDEAKILYVDAVMLIHPWDFWNPDGTPKPWTSELIRYTEELLTKNPNHPAALHYHIHLTEASDQPEVAIQSAHKLKNLMPGIPHMVHMASHEYERNGLYKEGVEVNILADSNLSVYAEKAKHLGLNTQSSHYFAVQTYCALTGGMYDDAVKYAQKTRSAVAPAPNNNYDQYLFMLPQLVDVRMGKWDQIRSDRLQIAPDWVYAKLLSHFTTGLAHAYQSDIPTAKKHLDSLGQLLKDPVLKTRRIPFNTPENSGVIAQQILKGVILYAQKQPKKALACFEKAVDFEDQLIHTEPKDWPLPSRQFLGAYLLQERKYEMAAEVYQTDLTKNPGNGWALTGLSNCLLHLNRTAEAEALKQRIQNAFSAADVLPYSSVFLE